VGMSGVGETVGERVNKSGEGGGEGEEEREEEEEEEEEDSSEDDSSESRADSEEEEECDGGRESDRVRDGEGECVRGVGAIEGDPLRGNGEEGGVERDVRRDELQT
jgi:hypothetical protein